METVVRAPREDEWQQLWFGRAIDNDRLRPAATSVAYCAARRGEPRRDTRWQAPEGGRRASRMWPRSERAARKGAAADRESSPQQVQHAPAFVGRGPPCPIRETGRAGRTPIESGGVRIRSGGGVEALRFGDVRGRWKKQCVADVVKEEDGIRLVRDLDGCIAAPSHVPVCNSHTVECEARCGEPTARERRVLVLGNPCNDAGIGNKENLGTVHRFHCRFLTAYRSRARASRARDR